MSSFVFILMIVVSLIAMMLTMKVSVTTMVMVITEEPGTLYIYWHKTKSKLTWAKFAHWKQI